MSIVGWGVVCRVCIEGFRAVCVCVVRVVFGLCVVYVLCCKRVGLSALCVMRVL